MYAPQLGRFLSRDPIGYVGGVNPYEFAAGQPTNLLDPSGLDPATAGVNCMQYATSGGDITGSKAGLQNFGLKPAVSAGIISPALIKSWQATGDLEGSEWTYFKNNPLILRQAVEAALKSKGLLPSSPSTTQPSTTQPNQSCPAPANCFKVQMYIYWNPNVAGHYDMHWIMQHPDGTWSGKGGPNGPAEPTNPQEQQAGKTYIGEWCITGCPTPTAPPPPPAPPMLLPPKHPWSVPGLNMAGNGMAPGN